jgi:large subunit ribosomal protein L22
MPGLKTNEREGTRAVLRNSGMSAYKAREVLNLIRGVDYVRATEILELTERGAAPVIGKLVRSAAANAYHNDGLDPEELFVSACYADEGTTMKRWRPRARGRATRIRKRTCHITVILSRMPAEELARRRSKLAADQAALRQRRVAGTRRGRRGGEAAEVAADEIVAQAEAVELATEAALGAHDHDHEHDHEHGHESISSESVEVTTASSESTAADTAESTADESGVADSDEDSAEVSPAEGSTEAGDSESTDDEESK